MWNSFDSFSVGWFESFHFALALTVCWRMARFSTTTSSVAPSATILETVMTSAAAPAFALRRIPNVKLLPNRKLNCDVLNWSMIYDSLNKKRAENPVIRTCIKFFFVCYSCLSPCHWLKINIFYQFLSSLPSLFDHAANCLPMRENLWRHEHHKLPSMLGVG